MTGRLVDMSFSLNRKQRITLEVDSDFRSLWDKLNQEPLLDIEIKKHRNKRSHSANAYFHVLVNKIAAETGESDDLVKERLVVAYGTVARDKDGCTVGFKLPVSVVFTTSTNTPAALMCGKRTENGSTATWFTRTPARWTRKNFHT